MQIDFAKLRLFESQNATNPAAVGSVQAQINTVSSYTGFGPIPANVQLAFENLKSLGIVSGQITQQLNS